MQGKKIALPHPSLCSKKIGLLVLRKSLQMPEMTAIPSVERAPTDSAGRRKRHATDPRPPRMRSAVTNGARLFVEGSGISAWSRRYADLIAGHCSDLGGRMALSEAQFSLIRRASAIECELEVLEGRMSQGAEVISITMAVAPLICAASSKAWA
jgi:hypothetical protein